MAFAILPICLQSFRTIWTRSRASFIWPSWTTSVGDLHQHRGMAGRRHTPTYCIAPTKLTLGIFSQMGLLWLIDPFTILLDDLLSITISTNDKWVAPLRRPAYIDGIRRGVVVVFVVDLWHLSELADSLLRSPRPRRPSHSSLPPQLPKPHPPQPVIDSRITTTGHPVGLQSTCTILLESRSTGLPQANQQRDDQYSHPGQSAYH